MSLRQGRTNPLTLTRFALTWLILLAYACPLQAAEIEKRSLYSAGEVLQRAASMNGQDMHLVDLLRVLEPGSVDDEDNLPRSIVNAAQSAGLHAVAFEAWTLSDLRAAKQPVILLIRPALDADHTDHYVLLESIKGDTAAVFTGRTQLMSVPILDLLHLWEGAGILVADEPLPTSAQHAARDRLLPIGFIIVALVGGFSFTASLLWRNRPQVSTLKMSRTAIQSLAIMVAAGLLAGGIVLLGGGAPLSDAHAVVTHRSSLLIDFRDDSTPVSTLHAVDITAEQLRDLLAAEDGPLFVDARTDKEYRTSHFKGAIGLPRFDAATIRLRLAGISKDRPIVVYCININCGRGNAASGSLAKAGFTQVSHYPPGWAELKKWKELEIVKGSPAPSDETEGL